MIKICRGDITESDCEAIVNAANNNLQLGAGVAGAIRRKGGPSIQDECNRLAPIKIGAAAITGAGFLKAKYVIHAASMGYDQPTTAATLQAATVAALRLCVDHKIESIAFPALGTGVSGFPARDCAQIMLATVQDHLKTNLYPQRVEFVLWDEPTYTIFETCNSNLP